MQPALTDLLLIYHPDKGRVGLSTDLSRAFDSLCCNPATFPILLVYTVHWWLCK